MKFTVKTFVLQEMMSKAVKGASLNRMLPLTSMLCIKLENNKLTLITTDMTNYLYISENNISGDDFSIVIPVDQFSKLIAKMTCEDVTLYFDEESLHVIGNGDYTIGLPIDEQGKLLTFPDPMSELQLGEKVYRISKVDIDKILTTVKPALSTLYEVPCYRGYRVGEEVIGTDTYTLCSFDRSLFEGEEVLVPPELVNLLSVMDSDYIQAQKIDDVLVFQTDNCTVYGREMEGLDDYNIDAIKRLLGQSFEHKCKVRKADLLNVLDRLSLFVGKYDDNGVYLTFNEDNIKFVSKQSNAFESVLYSESTEFFPFSCCINIQTLITQVKSHSADSIEIWYGDTNTIKIVDGDITQIIALLADDINQAE